MKLSQATPAVVYDAWTERASSISERPCISEVAQSVVDGLYERFEESLVLVRPFLTVPYQSLPVREREFAANLLGLWGWGHLEAARDQQKPGLGTHVLRQNHAHAQRPQWDLLDVLTGSGRASQTCERPQDRRVVRALAAQHPVQRQLRREPSRLEFVKLHGNPQNARGDRDLGILHSAAVAPRLEEKIEPGPAGSTLVSPPGASEWRQRLTRQGRPTSEVIELPVKDLFHPPGAAIPITQLPENA